MIVVVVCLVNVVNCTIGSIIFFVDFCFCKLNKVFLLSSLFICEVMFTDCVDFCECVSVILVK